jgi:L-serine deaminase
MTRKEKEAESARIESAITGLKKYTINKLENIKALADDNHPDVGVQIHRVCDEIIETMKLKPHEYKARGIQGS